MCVLFYTLQHQKVAIVKNTPHNNAALFKIKHLIEIKPITMPYGMPEDPSKAFLKENGEFVSYNLLEKERLSLDDAVEYVEKRNERHMDEQTLKHRLKKQWEEKYE